MSVATEAVLTLAEERMPGLKVVAKLRRDSMVAENYLAAQLRIHFSNLAKQVEGAALAVGVDEDNLDYLLTIARVDAWRSSILRPALERQYRDIAVRTEATMFTSGILPQFQEAINVPDRATLRDLVASRLLKAAGLRLGLVDIRGDTKRAIFEAIEIGRERGYGPRKVAGLIREMVPAGRFVEAGSKYRSEMIARTETLHAQRMATLEFYKESPVVHKVVAFDGEGDPQCAQRNGQHYTLEQAEVEMNITHPNCVLAFGPVVS